MDGVGAVSHCRFHRSQRTNGPMGMNQLPRIAVGTVQPDADLQVMLWALISTLERSGLHVQAFSSQSRFQSRDASVSITGEGRRHLDSWLMQPEVCAQLFYNADAICRHRSGGRPVRRPGGSVHVGRQPEHAL